MPRPLNEQVVVITGASSGIGREAALKFAQKGASVVLAARNQLGLDQVASEVRSAGGQAHVVVADVSEYEQMSHLASEAVSRFGRVDTWVNNAAVALYGTVDETSVEEMERVIHVNLLGTMYGVKAILPHMAGQGYGTIINIGSVLSKRSVPLQAAYCASKHGVKGFTESLRMELEHNKMNIKVSLIMPSSINTPFFNHARSKMGVMPQPLPPVYHPELVADAILHAAENPQREMFVGGAGWMLSFLERVSPALADRLMLTRGSAFKLQKTDEPDNGIDNLFEPSVGIGRTEGDFGELTKASAYTPLFEFRPGWAIIPGLFAGLLAFLGIRRTRSQS